MLSLARWLTLLLSALLFSSATGERLVVILLDGFRWDYAERMDEADVPAFTRLKNEGVHADYVQSIMPSESFPSWTTVTTGLYAESHGILGNNMYDPVTGEHFNLDTAGRPGDNTNSSTWWTKHVPLWTSATHQGVRTSMYYWNRCDVPFVVDGEAVLPEKCVPYNNEYPSLPWHLREELDLALADIREGFELILVYHWGSDNAGHYYGPDSLAVRADVKGLDNVIGDFIQSLEDFDLLSTTNIVIVTDHGTNSNVGKNYEAVVDYTDASNINMTVGGGAFSYVLLNPGVSASDVVSDLSAWDGVEAYAREDIPDHYHVGDSELALDVYIASKGEVYISYDYSGPVGSGGSHGFDDTSPLPDGYAEGNSPDMRGIFYAMGPSFKRGYQHQWIKLVDEYQIFAHVLGIEPTPHNGTWSRVQDMINN